MYGPWRQGRSFDLGRMTLRELVVAYVAHPAIHLYAVLGIVSAALAVHWAEGAARPLLAVAATVLAYPLAWYLIHRFVLHARFLYRSPLTAALWKRVHFDHHQDPHRLDVLFGAPVTTVPTIIGILIPLGWLIGGAAGAAAACATGFAITCLYEFCHCVQHLNFKPRNRLLRRMKELHLAHHFHHEGGNYGITSYVIDRAFGTYYAEARQRPRSPHAFNLGYDQEEARRYPWVERLTGAPPRDRPARSATRAAPAGRSSSGEAA
ncbi:sterol desaturase family protein [Pararoseomonas indoligenes]|uniref:Sterol desaturase family protein n=1 Tax=Roseomonas indoligenes TaxID=2820811 RepID=A0A940MVE5_9PROT|nr:sterol desaturase family protein [Pararoseomonas indoligenes]MBP0491221.1 sterol desaturase family protein [Pararoseomonas indoligenes]